MCRDYKKVCITNRKLCQGDFLAKLFWVKDNADIIILREKDLSEEDYLSLAAEAEKICGEKLVLHSFKDVAKKLGIKRIHLTYKDFCELSRDEKAFFEVIGVSTHTVDEAIYCEENGASYVTSSHIFETKCKEGLKPKGVDFLKEVTKSVNIPVFALGGINESNKEICLDAGAKGVCMMSEYMK